MDKRILFLLGACLVLFFGCVRPNHLRDNKTKSGSMKMEYTSKEVALPQKVQAIFQKMTLEEKLGQLNLLTSGDIVTGQVESSDIAKQIKKGQVTGVFNIKSVSKIYELQKIAVENSRLKIPLLFGMDVIHGYETIFPIPLGLAASWDLDLIEKTAQVAAKEATADGIQWTFSPMVDISRDPRWGRIAEGAGEDPYLGSKIAAAMVKGYQGNDLSSNYTMMSCVKHFALYGAPEGGRDYNTVDMSRLKMYNEYLPPFKATVDAGVRSVMTGFNEVDGIPATANKWLLTDLLRKEWGFDGFIVSDYTSINEMIAHGMGDLQTVSALSLNAGLDMDMVGQGFLTTLKKSLKEDKVKIGKIDRSVKLILKAKHDLGLFDNPYKYCDTKRPAKDIFTNENLEVAKEAAIKSFVLLKNDNQALPLKKSSTVALIGPLANTKNNMAGTWSGAAQQDKSISVLEGLQKKLGESKVIYAKGSNLYDEETFEKNATVFNKSLNRDPRSSQELITEALGVANKSDVIIAAVGESAEMSGESSSRSNIKIPESQKRLLRSLAKTGKPLVLVLFAGRPLSITEEDENKSIQAILNVWFPGSQAGHAIADLLFGDAVPSGKITATFPKNVGQIPIYYSQKNTGRPIGNKEGKFEKYRSNYLDVANEPLYPFGYGLSYTSFEYSPVKLSSDKLEPSKVLKVSVKVTNTGNYDGEEVVQLYTRDLVGSITRPVKELKGFQKIFLKKGESQTVTFDLTKEDIKFYNYDLDFVAEKGFFDVFIGGSSSTENKATFEFVN